VCRSRRAHPHAEAGQHAEEGEGVHAREVVDVAPEHQDLGGTWYGMDTGQKGGRGLVRQMSGEGLTRMLHPHKQDRIRLHAHKSRGGRTSDAHSTKKKRVV
jgi:hypothetical protein